MKKSLGAETCFLSLTRKIKKVKRSQATEQQKRRLAPDSPSVLHIQYQLPIIFFFVWSFKPWRPFLNRTPSKTIRGTQVSHKWHSKAEEETAHRKELDNSLIELYTICPQRASHHLAGHRTFPKAPPCHIFPNLHLLAKSNSTPCNPCLCKHIVTKATQSTHLAGNLLRSSPH